MDKGPEELKMRKSEQMVKSVYEIKEELKGDCNGELTDYARKCLYLYCTSD